MSDEAPSKELKLIIPDYITDDIIYKILLHVPVDSLLRFKSVCKSWLALISSPNFVKSQMAIAAAAAPDDQLHIGHSYDPEDESNTSISLFDVSSRRIVADLGFPFSPDEVPFMTTHILVGSASGIVCVCCTLDTISCIYLWNPSIKLSKRIPLHNLRHHGRESVVLGFGFDPIGNDFKVVRVVSPSFAAEVYSSSRNAWRNVDPNPVDFPIGDTFDVCFKGFLCTSGRYGMIAFDLNAEVFNSVIKFPAPTFDKNITEFDGFDAHARITEFNGSIAAIICRRSDYDRKINLWSLDDEACLSDAGVQASWTLRLNIFIDQPVQFVHGYFRGDDFLLLNNDVWYLYNSNNKESDLCIHENEKARNFMNAYYCGQIFRYTESLFKIDGFTQANWNAQEDDSQDDGEDDENEDDSEEDEDDVEDDIDLIMHFFRNIT